MKKLLVGLALLTLLLLVSTAAFAQSPSWPRWRGPNGDGISNETAWNPEALKDGAKVVWKVDIGFGFSDVAIQDGRLYTMGLVKGKWTVHCLDAARGKRIWQRNLDSTQDPWSTPCVEADRVYGLSKDGTLVCLRTSNGKLIWKKSLKDDFGIPTPLHGWASSPVVEGPLLLLSAGKAGLALDKLTGSLAWASSRGYEVSFGMGYYATPVVCDFDGKRCGLFYGELNLSAVDLASGLPVWKCANHVMPLVADPMVSGSRIFIPGVETRLLEMAPGTPKTIWSNANLEPGPATPVLVDGCVYGSHKGFLSFPSGAYDQYVATEIPVRCVEFATGKVMWNSPEMMPFVSICAAAGKLILLDVRGTLHIVEASPAAYREISSADVLAGEKRPRRFMAPPVLCGGMIYCRNYAGDLVCIDVSR